MSAIVEQDPELCCVKCKRPWTVVSVCCDHRIVGTGRHQNGICNECHAEFHRRLNCGMDAVDPREVAKLDEIFAEASNTVRAEYQRERQVFDELVSSLAGAIVDIEHGRFIVKDQLARKELLSRARALQGGAK